MIRPSIHETLMAMAATLSTRGTCPRLQVGCILASPEGRILGGGYNGAPAGAPHCGVVGCMMHEGHCVRAIHAETNAIGDCARRGSATAGATAYVTASPCTSCLGPLAAAGIATIYYREPYRSESLARELSILAGIRLVHLPAVPA